MVDVHNSKKSAGNARGAVWQRQFERDLDFPRTWPRVLMMICSTPRSGSHLLCHTLRDTGCFGYPLEYLNPSNFREWARRFGESEDSRIYSCIKAIRTSENGVFSIKAHYAHVARLHVVEKDPHKYNLVSVARRDKLRQAVSFARAEQTGSWISDMPELAEPYYDWRLIYDKLMLVMSDEAKWEAYFRLLGVEPLRVFYEDFVQDADAVIEKAQEYLGVEPCKHRNGLSSRFRPSRQTDGLAAEWLRRFIEESPSRLHHALLQEVELETKGRNKRRKSRRFARLLEAVRVCR